MNNEVLKEIYSNILNDAQRIRKEIMNEWGDILMFGGTMPPDVINELTTAARITGLIFDALTNHGVQIKQVAGKPELFTITVAGGGYLCHKTAIPSMVGFLDTVNIPGVSQDTTSSFEAPYPSNKEIAPMPVPTSAPVQIETPQPVAPEPVMEVQPEPIPEPVREEFPEPVEEVVEEPTPEPVETFEDTEEVTDEEPEEVVEEVVEEAEPEEEVEETVEDESTESTPAPNTDLNESPVVTAFGKKDIFIEEPKKAESEIIYEMFDITLTHSAMSGGGRPVEMQVMIAPLKIQKFAPASVPIIVSVYHNGKITTASSYDQQEDGKNLITLCIEEFYLLFRGVFTAEGKFEGLIVTTGISAAQADALNITSRTHYGNDTQKNVNNGHVKFRADIYDEPGIIEALPFGHPDEGEFVVMTRTDEFVDYFYVSNQRGGMKKPTIFSNGTRKEISCRWEDDNLCVDLLD